MYANPHRGLHSSMQLHVLHSLAWLSLLFRPYTPSRHNEFLGGWEGNGRPSCGWQVVACIVSGNDEALAPANIHATEKLRLMNFTFDIGGIFGQRPVRHFHT